MTHTPPDDTAGLIAYLRSGYGTREERDQAAAALTDRLAEQSRMPLRPGDVLAAGLTDGRCPVGIVTAVDGHGFRLDLYSWVARRFSAGTAIVRHGQVREFSDLAVQDDGGVFQMDPLAVFQKAWTEGQR